MKKLAFLFLSSFLILGCKMKAPYKYEIHGYVVVKGKTYPAIWYTDNYVVYEDSIVYYNSDSSMVSIKTPYVLYENK
jgi:uncharacterized protein YcfL